MQAPMNFILADLGNTPWTLDKYRD